MALSQWAVPQLSKMLPLDEDSLKQIISYTDTLSRQASADHLRDILGDSPQALEFITSFQQRRPKPPAEASTPAPLSNNPSRDVSDAEAPRPSARPKKKKAPLHQLPARQVQSQGEPVGGYVKKDEDDYMAGRSRNKSHKEPPLANKLALQSKPDFLSAPFHPSSITGSNATSTAKTKLPPSATGPLISDSLNNSRSPSPASQNQRHASTKINIIGGASMRGASTTLADLESAIRSLEMSTNPSLVSAADQEARRCNCMAQRHALFTAAPNCLSCGKIICAKEGLGPCTFCGQPLLKSDDVQAMLHSLREERGRERQAAGNAAHKKPDVSKAPRPFSGSSTPIAGAASPSPAHTPANGNAESANQDEQQLSLARQHRDRLLAYQSQNARRTHIRDEAADYETPDQGLSQWASPQERALQLKKQQKILREQEYNARPEYEKRRMVVSLDVDSRGKAKATRTFVKDERPVPTRDEDDDEFEMADTAPAEGRSKGTFARNPLLGGLIRPTFTPKDVNGKAPERREKNTWRRVQDDDSDNEGVILDGGAYGDRIDGRVLAAGEPAYG